MSYSVNLLTVVADCDAVISVASKEKDELEFRKTSLEHQTNGFSETAVEVDSELQSVDAELTAVTTVMSVLPEGPTKESNQLRKQRLELRKTVLLKRRSAYGSIAVLDKELELARTVKEIEETDAFIAAILARKAGL